MGRVTTAYIIGLEKGCKENVWFYRLSKEINPLHTNSQLQPFLLKLSSTCNSNSPTEINLGL